MARCSPVDIKTVNVHLFQLNEHMAYDRTKPFNDLPLLPPSSIISTKTWSKFLKGNL